MRKPAAPAWRPQPRGVQSKTNPSHSGAYTARMEPGDPKGVDIRGKPPKDGVTPGRLGSGAPKSDGY